MIQMLNYYQKEKQIAANLIKFKSINTNFNSILRNNSN